ncbi:MAG: hypothetical protein WC325_06740 [Candidatus Bathyarchaeia archaeon]|jgi:hypothetical protein
MSKQSTESKDTKPLRKLGLYPRRSLLDSLKIAQAIKEHSAGNPYDRLDLAKALNTTPSSSSFRTLISASGQFGLTEGSYAAKNISLAPLGKSIVFPQSEQEKIDGIKTALFSIPFYKKFFSDYDNNKLPTLDFLEGTLNRTYGIPVADCKTCYNLIVKNAEELCILDEISGSQYIRLNKLGTSPVSETPSNMELPAPLPSESTTLPPYTIQVPTKDNGNMNITVNISFELPISKDADVYDRIFQSLKKNLLTRDSKAD